MKIKARHSTPYIFIVAVIAMLLVSCGQNNNASDNTTVNENIIQTKGFSVNSISTGMNTSANGTVFIRGADGTAEHVQIVALIEIDPNDWAGVTFYISDNWHISSIISSYPENKAQSQPARHYVSTWTSKGSKYELSKLIEVGRDRSYIPTGGGSGCVVIDLYPDKNVIQQSETFNMMVAVGSDERDGIKISQPDFITLEIPIT